VAFASAATARQPLEGAQSGKALIYVSNWYDFNPFEKSRTGQAEFFENRFGTQMNRRREHDRDTARMPGRAGDDINDLRDRWSKFADATWCGSCGVDASREPREMRDIYHRSRAAWWACRTLTTTSDPVEFQEYLSNSINSLRVLADRPGGIAWSTRRLDRR